MVGIKQSKENKKGGNSKFSLIFSGIRTRVLRINRLTRYTEPRSLFSFIAKLFTEDQFAGFKCLRNDRPSHFSCVFFFFIQIANSAVNIQGVNAVFVLDLLIRGFIGLCMVYIW